jgi:hypothetical protein
MTIHAKVTSMVEFTWQGQGELYDAYRNNRFPPQARFDVDQHLQTYLAAQARNERRQGQASPSLLTHRDFFNTYVFPLATSIITPRPVLNARYLAETGLIFRSLTNKDCLQRLNIALDENALPSQGKVGKGALNSALIEWAGGASYLEIEAPLPSWSYLLVGYEALLLLHYILEQTPSTKLGRNLYERLKGLSEHSNRSDNKPPVGTAYSEAESHFPKLMDGLKNTQPTWLAVFSKCHFALKGQDEISNTSDTDLRNKLLKRLSEGYNTHLRDHPNVKTNVDNSINHFLNYAGNHQEDLGVDTRGRRPANPDEDRARATKKFCMWSCHYQNEVTIVLNNILPIDSANPDDFWRTLLGALLLYPLAKKNTVHDWLNHLHPDFTAEVLGNWNVLKWHERIAGRGVAVYEEIVPIVHSNASSAPRWSEFWADLKQSPR